MKKLMIAGLLFSIFFTGCKDEEKNYPELILGTWVNTHVNDEPILTDASFVSDFRSNLVEMYAAGVIMDDNNKTWSENENYSYKIEGNTIIIDGTDILENNYHMEFEILLLNESYLKYSVRKFTVNNVEYPDSKIYTNKNITTDYSEKFIGVWYGKCTTAGTSDTKFHYWEYFADGRFNYYYQNEAGSWIKKSDNDGGYFLYENLLATNYTNDLISGGTGKAYECWNFEIEGNNMTWTGLRGNNHLVTYQMAKVQSAPVVQ